MLDHHDRGISLQHYEIIFMEVLKRLPMLTALLTDIKSKSKTSEGLASVAGPGKYKAIEAVTLQALANAKLPSVTPVPMTEQACMAGWDAAMKQAGDPPLYPHKNRCLLFGQYICFLLAITQWLCPICLKRLLRPQCDSQGSRGHIHSGSGHDDAPI
jgi:hypothetical protein